LENERFMIPGPFLCYCVSLQLNQFAFRLAGWIPRTEEHENLAECLAPRRKL